MARPEFPKHVHDEQTFLTQIGSVKSRLRKEADLGIGTTAARIHLEGEFSKSSELGPETEEKKRKGTILKSWERGEVSLSSDRLRPVFDFAFGLTPPDAPPAPLPKSDYMLEQGVIKIAEVSRERQSKGRNQLASAVEDFIRTAGNKTGSDSKRQKPHAPPWDIPATTGDRPLMNGSSAIEFFREFYRCNQLPESLTIPQIEALIAAVEEHFQSKIQKGGG